MEDRERACQGVALVERDVIGVHGDAAHVDEAPQAVRTGLQGFGRRRHRQRSRLQVRAFSDDVAVYAVNHNARQALAVPESLDQPLQLGLRSFAVERGFDQIPQAFGKDVCAALQV